ncbi:MAG TPA: peptidoglycan-binding protein [Kofleriaceae bacterium]|jgi:hypothetical protein|nr:peptidoglycan-binding protein [Kofleriaceae bacterium]
MLLSGTLADLDLAGIAAMTSLGRTSLRLELRASTGDLIGSMVLKAGRVVSATAGEIRGRAALRVLLRAAGDARFQLAPEPLDFVLSSALASVDELQHLARGTAGSSPAPRSAIRGRADDDADPDDDGDDDGDDAACRDAAQPADPGSQARRAPTASGRIAMMRGRLDEFDLVTLLQTLGIGRQLIEIEVRDRAGMPLGTVRVKSGKLVAAQAGAASGVGALSVLRLATECFEFAAYRIATEPRQLGALASVAELGPAHARPPTSRPPTVSGADAPAPDDRAAAPPAGPVVMEGSLMDFDVRTVLEVLAATRQQARLQILDPGQPPLGEVALKAGWILSSQAGALRGVPALAFLLAASPRLHFRVLSAADPAGDAALLGRVHELLAGLPVARAARAASTRILRWAIPISFALGGAIVVLATRGGALPRGAQLRDRPAAPVPPAELAAASPSAPDAAAPLVPAPPAPPPPPPPPTRSGAAPGAPPDGLGLPVDSPSGRRTQTAQAAIQQLGYDPGALDGILGARTRNAILRFQRAQHLRLTGALDPATWSAIAAQLMARRAKP